MKITSKWSHLSVTENGCESITHIVMASMSTLLLSSFNGMLILGLPPGTANAAYLLTSTEAEKKQIST